MNAKNLLFFGDSSEVTGSLLDAVLKGQQSSPPLLSSFLERARLALRDEASLLPSTQAAVLPDFQRLDCLSRADNPDESHHPALQLVELTLVQLAHFINAHERAPKEPYPTRDNSVCVGVCAGEFAAAAVALSTSLNDLIPLAVDAVRLSFRAGILAGAIGNDIEGQYASGSSWALSVPRDTNLDVEENLLALHAQLKIPAHRHAWITTLGNASFTLAGPPSSLDLISEHLHTRSDVIKTSAVRRLPIGAPYHAGHIFSKDETVGIINQPISLTSLESSDDVSDDQRKILVGGSGGHVGVAGTIQQLVGDAIHEIFARQIDWKALTSTCKKSLSPNARVRSFGPDRQGRHLAHGLEVPFDAGFGRFEADKTSETIPIAIVGMAGRFPSANSPDEFWKVLSEGLDCVQEVPDSRFDKTVLFKDRIWGCFLENPGAFDPRFFHMSPREAVNTDPAHRLGLTTVQEALDMAGVVKGGTISTEAARIGSFWGNATEEYKEEYMSKHVDPYYIPGSSRAFAPGRVNFVYGFDGPAVSFDTACSSSMIALNHACNSIWNGDCGTAIVTGSNILTAPYSYKGLDLGHFLSKTGGCKSFDEFADGYCRGEAVATVIVKKLADAQADNDHILGVIRSISTNHSSASSSITRPHGPTQERLFRRLLTQANLKPNDISYVEMHGTGTQAGDSTEMTSVSNVLAPERRGPQDPLYVGAVKSNVGHGEGASGITSLVKGLLMLREQKIPPHVGIKSGVKRRVPDLDSKNIHIASELMDWQPPADSENGLRRVLISNFSAAGGNTSMILEEAPPPKPTVSDDAHRSHHIICVSGKSANSIQQNTGKLLEWARAQSDLDLSGLSYSTTVRRPHYDFRKSFVVSNLSDLEQQMEAKLNASSKQDYQTAKMNVVFSGYTNARSPAMQELFNTSRFFRSEVLRLDQSVQRLGYQTMIPFFESGVDQELSFIQKQLGYVVSQIATHRLLLSWGIRPSAVTGHSLGEYVALCASGIISSDDLIYLVGLRALALEQKCDLNNRGMLAVRTTLEDGRKHIQTELNTLEVSCINSPTDIVLSGPIVDLEKAEALFSGKSISYQRVNTPLAFHSSQMDAVIEDLSAAQSSIKFANPHTPLLSPTTGALVESASQLGSDYLKRHTRGIVNFHGALSNGLQENSGLQNSVWVEIGPHGICSPMVKLTLGSKTQAIPFMKRDEGIWATSSRVLGSLYNAGHNVDWKEYHREQQSQPRLLDIPSYVLDEQYYWLPQKKQAAAPQIIEMPAAQEQSAGPVVTELDVKISSKSVHKLTSRSEHNGFLMLAFETNLLEPHLYEIMQGHTMNDSHLCPASLYTDIALTIGDYLRENEFELQSNFRACVSTLDIHKPIIAPHSKSTSSLVMRIVAHSDLSDKRTKLRFETTNANGNGTQVHAQCQVYYEKKQDWLAEWSREQPQVLNDIGNLEAKLFRGLSQKLLSNLVYRLFDNVVIYGEKFKSMKEVLVDETQLQGLAAIELYQGPDSNGYACCPYWMDGLAHLAGFLINGLRQGSEKAVYISPGWANFRLADGVDPAGRYRSFVRIEDHGSTVDAECYILSGDQIVGKVDGLRFQMLPRSVINKVLPPGGPKPPGQEAPVAREQKPKDSGASSTVAGSTQMVYTPPTPPKTPPPFALAEILYEETGVAPEDIREETELVDLGIDSLLSLTITDRLREEAHLGSIPADLFQTHTTFGELETYIQSLAPKAPRQAVDVPPPNSTTPPNEEQVLTKVDSAVDLDGGKDDSTALREQVRGAIAEQMGMDAASLSPYDDLFDLGLDSLMSLEIVESLRVLGFDLEPDFFMSASTLEEVEKALFKSSPAPAIISQSKPAPPTTPNQRLSVCLQGDPSTTTKKLFLFPDGSGAAGVYSRLPAIDTKTCVYGLNSPYLKKGVVSGVTIEDMVRLWVDDIKTCQPQGPYHLGGYSSGGYYAYEAAKTLMSNGQSVETLICIDTPSRNVYAALSDDALNLVESSGVVGDGDGPTPAWLVDHFRSSLPAVARYRPEPLTGPNQPKTYLIWAASGIPELKRMMLSKGKFSGIEKFFAGEKGPLRPHGWGELIGRQNIRMARAAGNHFSIVHKANAKELGDLIHAAIVGKDDAFESLTGPGLEPSSSLKWQPQAASFGMDELRKYLGRKAPAAELSLKHQLNTLVLLYVQRILDNISEPESRRLAPHIQRYYTWMQHEMQLNPPQEVPDEDITALEVDIAGSGVDGALLSRIGRKVLEIMRDQCQPLQLMLQDKLLFEYYPNTLHTAPCYPRVEFLVRRELTTAKPLNILEIGAGTGATTKAMFRVIGEFEKSEGSNPGFGHYTYTDVSAGFFKQAKDTFKPHVSRMTFKKLDIEESPLAQGFEAGTYDLILASQCLHATKNMTETMTHVRELLKPGGKVIMVEGTREALDISFIFGALPGWWLGVEDIRKLTPCLDVEAWDGVLRKTGFNGIDLVVPNCDNEVEHTLSVIMASAV